MTDERQQLIQDITNSMAENVINNDQLDLKLKSDEVIEAAYDYMQFITPAFKNEEISKLMYRLTNSPDESYERKVLCGLTLAVIIGAYKFTDESAERLISAYYEMLLAEDTPEQQSSIIKLMQEVYLKTKAMNNIF